MTGPFVARDRRALVGGAIIVAALAVGARGVPAWRRWHDGARLEAAAARAELDRVRASLGQARLVADSLRARRSRLRAVEPVLLAPAAIPVAAAELATVISSTATATGVRVASMQPRSEQRDSIAHAGVDGDRLRRIGVRIDAIGDVRGLARMLAALERGPLLMAVRSLTISQADVGAPHDRAEILRIELLVDALARADSASEARR
jgi:type II secretion system (T2SS) protein M